MDHWGNVAAVTHSIYTAIWGNTGIFVAGISIPDPAAFLQDAIKRAGPGRRLPDAISPLIITRDGKPILASTAIGGGLHQQRPGPRQHPRVRHGRAIRRRCAGIPDAGVDGESSRRAGARRARSIRRCSTA